MRWTIVLAGGLAGVLLLAGCSGPAPAAPVSTAPPTTAAAGSAGPAAEWPTYHRDDARTGLAPAGPAPDALTVAWRARLDGAVYGQPLVVGGLVLAATEGDSVYGLDPDTGAVRWRTNLGTPVPRSALPCGNIDPLGITGTMAYDQATGRVFAVAETTGGTHTLVGLNAVTGAVQVRVPLPPPHGDELAHQQRAALTVLDGRVYAAYGGLAGDCAAYIGSVVSVTTAGADRISYAVPTTREAGIWAPGGAAVTGGNLLYAAGNGESTDGYDGSDSVIALTPGLRRAAVFAPATWPDDNANDLDLGSSTPTVLGPWILIAGKRGTAYVLRAPAPTSAGGPGLGGVGGQVSQFPLCKSFGGSAVSGGTAYVPCPDGVRAVTISPTGQATVRWHSPVPANGSPVVTPTAVWVPDYATGTLHTLAPTTGQQLATVEVGDLPHFASPTLTPTHAYLGTLTGLTALKHS
jgi:polyvinyl alcohol dehydrogenase (cytochrome)